MEKKFLGRGVLAGALGGLLAFVFARIFAEPQIQAGIDYEGGRDAAQETLDKAAGLPAGATEPDIVSRAVQADVGLLDRVAAWLTELSGRTGRIVAITHPSIIRAALVHVLHAQPESFWRLDVTPLSHTILSAHQHRWTLRETGHPLAPVPAVATGVRVSPFAGPEPAEPRSIP